MRFKHIPIALAVASLLPIAAACGNPTLSVGECVTVSPGFVDNQDPAKDSGNINQAECPKQFDLSQQVYRVDSVIHDVHGQCHGIGTAIQYEDGPNGVVYCLSPALAAEVRDLVR